MYNENEIYVANPCLNFRLTRKEFLQAFKTANWRSKLIWLFHPRDTYGKHLERYYNHPTVKKAIFSITKREER
ncbi:MAG: hypothetical protein II220_09770 [Spirochaetales bacterium]|nr:hypothetical protein [Spirochaetales bacterium]